MDKVWISAYPLLRSNNSNNNHPTRVLLSPSVRPLLAQCTSGARPVLARCMPSDGPEQAWHSPSACPAILSNIGLLDIGAPRLHRACARRALDEHCASTGCAPGEHWACTGQTIIVRFVGSEKCVCRNPDFVKGLSRSKDCLILVGY